MPTADRFVDKSLDTRDDCDNTNTTIVVSNGDDGHLFNNSTKHEENQTIDTFGDDILGTALISYIEGRGRNGSLNTSITFRDDTEACTEPKKLATIKDIIIH